MCKYPTRISLIILLLSLISCDACKDKPQAAQEKQSAEQEKLKTEIQELEFRRKQQINTLIDDWNKNQSSDPLFTALKQGEIDKVYQGFIKLVVESEAKDQNKLCDKNFIQG